MPKRNGHRKKVLLEAVRLGYKVGMDGTAYNPKGQPLKPYTSSGYPSIGVRYKGVKRNVHIHRLQAFQKFGNEIFKPRIVVRHINNDKDDASHRNIELGTQYENWNDNPEEVQDRVKSNLKNYKRETLTEDQELQSADEIGF